MNTGARLRSLERWVKVYEDVLKEADEEEFSRSPADGGWSRSEVFSHIFQANLACLIAIEKCALGTGKVRRQLTNPIASLILFVGRLPRGIKSPARTTPIGKISREDAANLITRFRIKLQNVNSHIKAAPWYGGSQAAMTTVF